MATWTQVNSNIYNGSLVWDIVADDRYIWFLSDASHVRRYDTRHDSVEDMSDSNSFEGGSIVRGVSTRGCGIAKFKGRFYVIIQDAPDTQVEIWRWVSGKTWERVYQDTTSGYILRYLQANGRVITATVEDTGGDSNTVWYSKTGDKDSWVQTTIPTIIGGGGAFSAIGPTSRQGNQRGIYMTVGPADGSDYGVYKFDETLLNWQRVLDGTEYDGSSKNWHWRRISATNHQFSASFGNWRTPSDPEIEPIGQYRMPRDIGYKDVAGDYEIYLWDDDAEDWEGSAEDTIPDIDSDGGVVRMPDQEVYLFLQDTSNNNEVWKRDEPLAGAWQTEGEVTLFHGNDELLERVTYQFEDINPGNMSLTKARTVYAASSVAGDVMAERAERADDYETAEDATEGLDTSEGINSVARV